MSALNILIVGAGVAGPALALLLHRADPDHTITIAERWPSLRAAGQQIDLRAGGLRIIGRMGLLDAVRARCVAETGLAFVDARGRSLGRFGVRAADASSAQGDRNRRALTNEYEIMRGDLVKVLYEASLAQDAETRRRKEGGGSGSSNSSSSSSSRGGLTYEFGLTITELSQEAISNGVDVTFSDGRRRRFDLVVAADGMGSRTRRLAFGRTASDAAFRSLGIHAAYYDVPSGHDKEEEEAAVAAKDESAGDGGTDKNAAAAAAAAIEKGLAKAYVAPGRRLVMTRRSGRPRTQVLLFKIGAGGAGGDALRRCYSADGSAAGAGDEERKGQRQKEAFAEAFRGAGWETDRLLEGMAATEDFYAFEAGQIRMGRSGLSRGRVVLLGDAGYCPCPLTGMGTECCLVGAYVLAGELAKRRRRGALPEEGEDAGGDDYSVTEALARYEEVVGPIVEDLQRLPGGLSYMFPSSRVGVWILNQLVWIAAKLDQIMYRPDAQADKPVDKRAKKAPKGGLGKKMDYGLAEYPELNLDL